MDVLVVVKESAVTFRSLTRPKIHGKEISTPIYSFQNEIWTAQVAERLAINEKVLSYGTDDDEETKIVRYLTSKEENELLSCSSQSVPEAKKCLRTFAEAISGTLAQK